MARLGRASRISATTRFMTCFLLSRPDFELDLTPDLVSDEEVNDGTETIFCGRVSAEEIIQKLREAEVHLSQGNTIPEACRKIGVTDQTYYRWRKEYGGVRTDQAKRLKELERENARLKKLVAEAELDKAILREAASGNF